MVGMVVAEVVAEREGFVVRSGLCELVGMVTEWLVCRRSRMTTTTMRMRVVGEVFEPDVDADDGVWT